MSESAEQTREHNQDEDEKMLCCYANEEAEE